MYGGSAVNNTVVLWLFSYLDLHTFVNTPLTRNFVIAIVVSFNSDLLLTYLRTSNIELITN